VKDHARKLLEKYTGEPFFESVYNRGSGRMGRASFQQGLGWLDRHFTLLRCEDDQLPSIDWVLDLARVAVLRYLPLPGAAPLPLSYLHPGDARRFQL
jgi:twinkle protein